MRQLITDGDDDNTIQCCNACISCCSPQKDCLYSGNWGSLPVIIYLRNFAAIIMVGYTANVIVSQCIYSYLVLMHAWSRRWAYKRQPVHCKTITLISSYIFNFNRNNLCTWPHAQLCACTINSYYCAIHNCMTKPAFSCLPDVFAGCAGTAWVQVLVSVFK